MAVTNFTATEIGDYFFAKLQEPFEGVTKVIGWDILVGVNSPNSVGTLSFNEGENLITGTNVNWNLSTGNKIIVGSQVFTIDAISGNTIITVEPATFTATNAKWYEYPDSENYFTFDFRYSQEGTASDGGQMSELRPLNTNLGLEIFRFEF